MNRTDSISGKGGAGFSRSEVAAFFESVADLHRVEMKDNSMEFPCVLESALQGAPETVVIPFGKIASIAPYDNRIELYLLSGDLFVFSTTDGVCACINAHTGGRTMDLKRPVTADDIGRNIWDELGRQLSGGKQA